MQSYFKALKWRSQHYRDFIGTLPCDKCGKPSGYSRTLNRGDLNDPHHSKSNSDSGVATKASDVYLTSLCHSCHLEYDRVGEITFWGNKDVQAIQLKHLNQYLTERKVK